MKQPEQIEHKGVVLSTEEGVVRVAIKVSEACGGCSARKSCAMGQTTRREIEIFTAESGNYSIGEVVKVGAKQSLGIMAVVLCYIVPLVVLVATLAIAVAMGLSEGVSAMVALGFTAIYYALLALMRNRISKRVTFTINKI